MEPMGTEKLPNDAVKLIQEYIAQKVERNIVNPIIRDDVFSLLQMQKDCIVLYYPYPQDSKDDNDFAGCHVERTVSGRTVSCVFINTNNPRERQAFAAAHELGHILKVDQIIKQQVPSLQNDKFTEVIVNRFVAELLMPEELFRNAFHTIRLHINKQSNRIEVGKLLRLIVYLMDYFFVPFKAVVIRFNELNLMDAAFNKKVLDYRDSQVVKKIMKTRSGRLGFKDRAKSIRGLSSLLRKAKENGTITEKKYCEICTQFDIDMNTESPQDCVTISEG